MSAVRSRDRGYAATLKRIYGFGRPQVVIGILAKEGSAPKETDEGVGETEGVTVADIATWMEFGTDDVPERSFIRAWYDEASPRMREDFRKLVGAVLKGTRTKEQILELVGLKGVGEIQARIAEGIPPALAAATVKAKGSSKPLIRTGQLRSSISHAVRERPR